MQSRRVIKGPSHNMCDILNRTFDSIIQLNLMTKMPYGVSNSFKRLADFALYTSCFEKPMIMIYIQGYDQNLLEATITRQMRRWRGSPTQKDPYGWFRDDCGRES